MEFVKKEMLIVVRSCCTDLLKVVALNLTFGDSGKKFLKKIKKKPRAKLRLVYILISTLF